MGKIALFVFLLPAGSFIYMFPGPIGWRHAGRVFTPKATTVPLGGWVAGLQTARTVTGFVLVAAAYVYVLGGDDGVNEFVSQLILKGLVAIGVGLIVLILGLLAIYAATSDARRDDVRARLRYPARSVGFVALGTAACALVVVLMTVLGERVGDSVLVTALLLVVGVIGVGYLVGFGVRGAFLVGKHIFNVAEVHPLAPAMLASVLVWALAVIELVQGGPLAPKLHAALTLGGAVTVTLLALVEWLVLRRQWGLSIRNGPEPLVKPSPRSGVVSWVNSKYRYGVIATGVDMLTFADFHLRGPVVPGQRVTFDRAGTTADPHATDVQPGEVVGAKDAGAGCPECGQQLFDEDIHVRNIDAQTIGVFVAFTCKSCGWTRPETHATIL